MFKIYFKVALRNILRDRLYAAVNILGLSLGIAVSIIVFLYIQSELSFDQYHPEKDRLYRVTSTFIMSGEAEKTAVSSRVIGPLLQEQNSGIEAYARLQYTSQSNLTSAYASGKEDHLMAADSSFISLFKYKLLKGDPVTCLSKPMTVVLSERLATKYFGDRDPMGQKIKSGTQKEYMVTGVLENIPESTHHYFEGLFSMSSLRSHEDMGEEKGQNLNLWGASVFTFLLLKDDYPLKQFYADFPRFWERNMAEVGKKLNGFYYPVLQPIADIHMAPALDYDYFEAGNLSYIYGFAAIGLFLLLLAAINYTNMATARASMRTREVGLRKVMGSRRHHLMFQFWGEALLTSFIALLIALAMVEMILELTPFNELMSKQLQLNLVENPTLTWSILLTTLLLGLLSGAYPAFSLAWGNAGQALRARRRISQSSISLRKGLVIFQFTVSIGVIISTFLMKNQVDYMRTVDLGYSADNTAILPMRDTTSMKKLPALRARLESLPSVIKTTTANNFPGGNVSRRVFRLGREENNLKEVVCDVLEVGTDYLDGMGLKLLEGKDFTQSRDSLCHPEFIINETAAREYFGGDAIGKNIRFGLKMGNMQEYLGSVIGVVKDFNVHSLRYEMRPLIIKSTPKDGGLLHVRLAATDMPATMEAIHKTWKNQLGPEVPFTPFFINEKFEKLYAADRRLSSLMGILAYLCVLISVMGLLGFSSFSIEQRKKEIGIRKVLGASLVQIVVMLFREIFFLIIFSSMLGSILAYLVVQLWLEQFAYQAEIPVATFFLAGLMSLALALVTVSYHSIKAALYNPVHALKYE
jgi:putative ABC transport system permease protein